MENDLMVLKDYALTKMDAMAFAEAMKENLGPDGLSEYDLQRIKMPSGASGTFTIPTLDGEDYVKEIVGTIIFQKNQNAYWDAPFDGSKNPPTCSAKDGIIGVGIPGGECAKCVFNQFGSDMDGKGKACKNLKTLFVICKDNMLPFVISLPPTSLGNAKSYLLKLAGQGKSYWKVSTKITLEKSKSAGGIDYMKAKLTFVEVLSDSDIIALSSYRDSILPMLKGFDVTADAYEVDIEE